MKELYDRHANSGFFQTELPLGGKNPSAGQVAQNAVKTVSEGLRRVSDMREDFGRFAHFVHAMRDEAKGLSKRGVSQADLIEKATDAAVWRVNHYKFDYSALTAFERKIKLAFPFYTFSRKAAPTLLQQLALHPKYLGLANRWMEYNDGSAADSFNAYYLPDYVKDIGYGMLNDEEEPLYMTQDILPTAVLNSLDFSNSQQFAQSAAQQMNPIGQIPFEMALGKEIFSGAPTGDFQEYITNKFSIPGQFTQQVAGNDSDPQWLQLLNEGFTGAGIPVRQFTTEQQDFGFREMEDRFIQDPFSDFNRQDTGFRVYQSNRNAGTSFRVENVATGEVVYETQDPAQALAHAKRITGQ
jgi:hypothetical protein